MFKRNEGIIDRALRVLLSMVLMPTGLFWLGGLQGRVLGLVIAGFSLLPLITGLTGFCPLYVPIGYSTLEKEKELMDRCMSMMAGRLPGNRSTRHMRGPDPQSVDKTSHEQA